MLIAVYLKSRTAFGVFRRGQELCVLSQGVNEMSEYTILVVDDERWIRLNLKRILESDGHTVLPADSGQAALVVLKEHKVDLILSDQRMPRMSGLELLEHARTNHPDIIRVMLTGFADLQLALDAINKVEIHRLLLKPYSNQQILGAVKELLQLRAAGTGIPVVDLNKARIKKKALDDLQKDHPGIDQVQRDRGGRIVISEEDFDDLKNPFGDMADLEDLLKGTEDKESGEQSLDSSLYAKSVDGL